MILSDFKILNLLYNYQTYRFLKCFYTLSLINDSFWIESLFHVETILELFINK